MSIYSVRMVRRLCSTPARIFAAVWRRAHGLTGHAATIGCQNEFTAPVRNGEADARFAGAVAFEPAGDQNAVSVASDTLLTARARCWMEDLVAGRVNSAAAAELSSTVGVGFIGTGPS